MEIIDLILSHLRLSTYSPSEYTRALGPVYWHRALVKYDVLPWLWDLDREAISSKEVAGKDMVWDWELLARQLARVFPVEPTGGFSIAGAFAGLQNRRRIWRLVEEMRTDEDALYGPKDL